MHLVCRPRSMCTIHILNTCRALGGALGSRVSLLFSARRNLCDPDALSSRRRAARPQLHSA